MSQPSRIEASIVAVVRDGFNTVSKIIDGEMESKIALLAEHQKVPAANVKLNMVLRELHTIDVIRNLLDYSENGFTRESKAKIIRFTDEAYAMAKDVLS